MGVQGNQRALSHFESIDCPGWVQEKSAQNAIKAVRAKIRCRPLGSKFVGLTCEPGSKAFAFITLAFAGLALGSH